MTKLMNLNLQNAEILDKKEMKQVTGGDNLCPPGMIYSSGMCYPANGSGTCAWHNPNSPKGNQYGYCNVPKEVAVDMQITMGGTWCCDSCTSLDWWQELCGGKAS